MQYIHFGCKTNQYESNAMASQFEKSGYKIVKFDEKADVYIVNTCTVTNISDRKSRQILRRAKQINKNRNIGRDRLLCTSRKRRIRKI